MTIHHTALVAPSIAVMVLLFGCGSDDSASTVERCFGGGIFDYGSDAQGELTPGEAVRALALGTKSRIETELESVPATEERDRRLREDRAAIRGLEALQARVDGAEGAGTYEATDRVRNVSASVTITQAASGGYLVTGLTAEADCEDAS